MKIANGFCQCGCGGLTSIAKKTNTKLGHIQGKPVQFIYNHHMKGKRLGENHPMWKGGKIIDSDGYIWIKDHQHPHSNKKGYISEHYLVAEKALGKSLPERSCIHHVDEIRSHNEGNNLVICQDKGYHRLLHSRIKALKKCGHANWIKCQICHEYDAPENLYLYPGRKSGYHKACRSNQMKEEYLRQKKEVKYNA